MYGLFKYLMRIGAGGGGDATPDDSPLVELELRGKSERFV